jgi:hypothetical protein
VSAEGRFLVTLDHDFSDIRRYGEAPHSGVLLLRTSHPSSALVSMILSRVLGAEGGIETLAGCLAVADESRTRVRRPRRR